MITPCSNAFPRYLCTILEMCQIALAGLQGPCTLPAPHQHSTAQEAAITAQGKMATHSGHSVFQAFPEPLSVCFQSLLHTPEVISLLCDSSHFLKVFMEPLRQLPILRVHVFQGRPLGLQLLFEALCVPPSLLGLLGSLCPATLPFLLKFLELRKQVR